MGRAGRSLEAAYGVLLSGEEETEINRYFIESAFPTREHVHGLMAALEDDEDGLSIAQLLNATNISKGRIQKTLALLSIELPPPVVKRGSRWQVTGARLNDAFWERAERMTRLRREEEAQMQRYVTLQDGHMPFLIQALDGEAGDFRRPDLPRLPVTAAASIVREAATFLREAEEENDARVSRR